MSQDETTRPKKDRMKTERREFLRRSGKVLAYSVPVIYSLHSTPLKAQQASPGSVGSVSNLSQTQTTLIP